MTPTPAPSPHHDRSQLERLWANHRVAVSAYLLRRTDPDSAQDALSDTFAVAWRRIGEIPPDALPWLIGVARRCLANQRRGQRRRGALHQRLTAGAAATTPDHAAVVVAHDAALTALASLRAADRELLMMIAWDGLTAHQAATALGISGPRLAVRLHRARRRLEHAMVTDVPHPTRASPTPHSDPSEEVTR